MEWLHTVFYISLSIFYLGSWFSCGYGQDMTDTAMNRTQSDGFNSTRDANSTKSLNDEFNESSELYEMFNGTTQSYYTEIVTELVTYIDGDVTTAEPSEDSELGSSRTPTKRRPTTANGVVPDISPYDPYTGGDVGLWVAIGVIGFAALVVFLTLLATVLLRWKRKRGGTSYDVERDENEHTNPAYDAGEIAGLEPSNGMKEVSIGLTTFADEDSKAVL